VIRVKDLLSKFDVGDFEFKEPWRAGKALAVIVPIVAKRAEPRSYVVLEEVKDKARIVDTGRIGEVKVEGEFDKPTFIRGGTMLKGATQERATEFSVVVTPGKAEVTIPVHCVHASKGIRPGAFFTIAMSYTPPTVHSNMLAARNQTVTWNAVARYSSNILERWAPSVSSDWMIPRVRHDDLVGVQESLTEFRKELEEMLSKIPDYVNQVGSVVIDPDGVVGLELYDHPESWKTVTEKIKRTFTEVLTREDKAGIFKPDMDAALTVINELLEKLEKPEEERTVFSQANARTAIFKVEGYVGEYTTLNNKTIHLTITRREEEAEKPQPLSFPQRRWSERSAYESTAGPATVFYTTPTTAVSDVWSENWKRRMRKGVEVLTSLEEPKTWTSLTSELKMSKATLSSSLKRFQQMGLVEKYRGPNGVTRYSLTAYGQELKKRLSQ
jgi:DNA-binding HxlR family transcriptional regulator/predicted ester cyclase